MDAITQINSNTSSKLQENPAINGELGKDQFLQLLVSQLRNQDPLNPMEGAEFASQLAQFNQVEQLLNVNEGIENLAELQGSSMAGLNNTLATTITGKHIKAIGNGVSLGESGEAEMAFKLNNPASDVTITIRDESGNVVREQSLVNLPKGDNAWTWDGTNNQGSNMPEGNYTYEVSAQNGNENVESLTYVQGVVDRVRFGSDGVQLFVDGMYVSLGEVEEIGESPQ